MRILVVDDVVLVRKLVGKVIETLGGNLFEASNGIEALAVLDENRGNVDLILLDWNMPEMDGFEFLNRVKENSRFQHIPVIMVTNEHEKKKIIKAIQAGASNYLAKPFTEQELTQKIAECLMPIYDRFARCFSNALANTITAVSGQAVVERDEYDQKQSGQQDYVSGQILVLGKVNSVVFLTMNKETATRVTALMADKTLTGPDIEASIEGMTALVDKVVAGARILLSEADLSWSISTPFSFFNCTGAGRSLCRHKAFMISRKYCTRDMEVSLRVYCL